MRSRLLSVLVVFVIMLSVGDVEVKGACPSMDVTGDCRVDLEDFAVFASQWLMEGIPEDPAILWVSINDPGVDVDGDGTPDHEPFNGEMSRYETTNAQYCEFLNAALASGDITVGGDNKVYGANGSNSGADFVGEVYFDTYTASSYSQIIYSGSTFIVRSRDGYDMSNHPVVVVSWYGATAFCNYYGYRLPTEWEWQAVADYDGTFTYGCGTTIDSNKANYNKNNPLDLSSYPYTSPVNHYSSYGYGMNDMAGNVWEWTSSLWDPAYSFRVSRGGSWNNTYDLRCAVRSGETPSNRYNNLGFRVCR